MAAKRKTDQLKSRFTRILYHIRLIGAKPKGENHGNNQKAGQFLSDPLL